MSVWHDLEDTSDEENITRVPPHHDSEEESDESEEESEEESSSSDASDRDASEFCNSPFPETTGTNEQLDYEDEDEDGELSSNTMVASITADIDSMFLISHNYRKLIDVSCREGSIWKIGSSIQRTKCDSGSRANLFFTTYPKPLFAHRSSTNKIPCEWFPNLTFCRLSIAEGVTLWFTFYLMGCPTIRTCHYLTKLELSVFVSAMNYARNYWCKLTQTRAIVMGEGQALKYQVYMSNFQRFKGIVKTQRGIDAPQSSSEDVPSSYGRIFVASIFEAMKLFATYPYWATGQMLDGRDLEAGINTFRSHGIEHFEPSIELFSRTAAYMVRSGVLSAKSAGLKKTFERLPCATIDLNVKPQLDLFIHESFTFLTKQVGLYFDPSVVVVGNNLEDTNSIRRQPLTGSPTLEDIQYSNTHAHFNLDREFSSEVMVFFDLGLNITPAEMDCSFLPSGMHSVWMVNHILNGNRIPLPASAVRTNDTLFDQLKRIDNDELLRQILEIISRGAGNQPTPADADLEAVRRSLDTLEIFDFEREVLDLIQDELAIPDGDTDHVGDGVSHFNQIQ
jgi:hypothetical protein